MEISLTRLHEAGKVLACTEGPSAVMLVLPLLIEITALRVRLETDLLHLTEFGATVRLQACPSPPRKNEMIITRADAIVPHGPEV
jgi:hypothetical protein